MSFSSDVKQEMTGSMPKARHCRIAELAALLQYEGSFDMDNGIINIISENNFAVDRIEKLIKKIFSIDISERIIYDRRRSGKDRARFDFTENETGEILKTVKADFEQEDIRPDRFIINPFCYTMNCCKRAFLRGAFISTGSLSDPKKDYHLELALPSKREAEQLTEVIASFGIEARQIIRKKQYVVYVKDSENIVDLLNVMEAHVALMNMENVRILKEMRNSVNRRVNCEASNIRKTVAASAKQIEDIIYVREHYGLDRLNEGLAFTARLRIENPDATLNELVELHRDSIGRSGINHRLNKISELADRLRNEAPEMTEEENDHKEDGN